MGVNRNTSSTTLEPVEWLSLYNYFSTPQGLIRGGVAADKEVSPDESIIGVGTTLTGGGHFSPLFSGLPANFLTVANNNGYITSQTLERYPEVFGNYEDMVNTEFNSGEKRTFLFTDRHIFLLNGSDITIADGYVGAKSEWDYFTLNGFSGLCEKVSEVNGVTTVRLSLEKTTNISPYTLTPQNWETGLTVDDTVIFEIRENGNILGFTEPLVYTSSNAGMLPANQRTGVQYAAKFKAYASGNALDRRYIELEFTDNPPPFDAYGDTLHWQFVVGYIGHSQDYDYIQFNDKFLFSEKADKTTYQFGVIPGGILGAGAEGFYPFDWNEVDVTNVELRGLAALASHRERMIVGNTYEIVDASYQRYPMRIRWTQPYENLTIRDINYYDFNEYGDEIVEIVPYLDTIWVFMRNSIYVGRIAGIPNLPYVFTKLPTAGVGITSKRAVSVIDNNIIFIAKDDVYKYNTEQGLTRVGTKIFNYLKIDQGNDLKKSVVAHIPERQTVAFLFRSSKSLTGQLWAYNLITEGWSTLLDSVGSIAYAAFTRSTTYDTYGDSFDSQTNIRFQDLNDTITDKGLVLFKYLDVFAYLNQKVTADSDIDFNNAQLLETGDLNFGLPNVEKVVTRFSIALAETYNNTVDGYPLEFKIEYSNDRGQRFYNIGTLRIANGKNEGKIDFRATGSTLRFRVSTVRVNTPYTIIEYALRVRSRGIEINFK